MKRYFKYLFLVLFFSVIVSVDAKVTCEDGKPGATVNCVVNNAGRGGKISNIVVSDGLTFVSCDVCNDSSYTIEANKDANFKFKISDKITESKTLTATFGGEDVKIKVVVDSVEEDDSIEEENNETIYSVTLVPGNGQSNKTLTCTVNSLNSTCNVTLEDLELENFNGWGKEKDCTEGAKGSIKVNKNITYYACYKKNEIVEETPQIDTTLLLKSLVIKNGDEKISLGFSIRRFEYDITIPLNVESLDVTAIAQDENVNVLIEGNTELKEENNIIKIKLSNEDGKSNEYTINVKKSDDVSLPLLTSLVVGGYNIGFDSEKFVYDLTIDSKINSLNIQANPSKENYEYSIIGNKDLKDGSKISIVVKNKDTDKTSTYVINIHQDTTNLLIYIGIGGIVLIILIILLIIVVKKGKKVNKVKSSDVSNTKVVKKYVNGQVVNNKGNIPEVKSVAPVVPTNSSVVKEIEKKEDIETLDL